MPPPDPLIQVLPAVAAFLAVGAWLSMAVERAPVSRYRLERFAHRHDLTVSAANGNRIIEYLAVTWRWRATGLTAGLLISIGAAAEQGDIRVDFLTLFAGWFVGALVAEMRLARTSFGPHRAAYLAPRHPTAYLPRAAWILLAGAVAASLAIAAVTAVAALRGRPVGSAAAPLFAAAVAVVVLVRVIQLRVLRRPQPVAAPDLLAADDAIRSRSLHVLAGGGTSLVLYCGLGQLAALAPALSGGGAANIEAANFLGAFAVPLLGWSMATARWPIRRGAWPAVPSGGTA